MTELVVVEDAYPVFTAFKAKDVVGNFANNAFPDEFLFSFSFSFLFSFSFSFLFVFDESAYNAFLDKFVFQFLSS